MLRVVPKLSILVLVCLAVAGGSLIIWRPRHVHADDTKNCVKSSANACETCKATGDVYQCDPEDLPTNYDYGSCISQTGKCAKSQIFECGQFTKNCADPPKTIQGESACEEHSPNICAEVQPDPPGGGT